MAGPFFVRCGRMLGLSGGRLSGSNPRWVHESANVATNSGLNLSASLQTRLKSWAECSRVIADDVEVAGSTPARPCDDSSVVEL